MKRLIHACHVCGHLVYFALVAWEAHGLYGYAAGALFVLSLIGLALGENE